MTPVGMGQRLVPALLVRDMAAALALELRGKVDFAWGPETMDDGVHEFGVQDPNGYFIAFTEPA